MHPFASSQLQRADGDFGDKVLQVIECPKFPEDGNEGPERSAAGFDTLDGGDGQSGRIGEGFLRHIASQAERLEASADFDFDGGIAERIVVQNRLTLSC